MQFLHRLDGLRGEAQWVETTPEDLARATFLDGRETFWSSSRIGNVEPGESKDAPRARLIFHVGFCGSTLLTRMIERWPGVLALREPQALTDLASQQAQLAAGQGTASLARLLSYALTPLGAVGGARDTIIKPSNWVNGLIPVLAEHGLAKQALCMTMERRAYLRAIFRGGRDRIAFALRHVQLLAASDAVLADQLRAAIALDGDALNQAARAAALLHRAQENLFAQLAPRKAWLGFETLVDDPQAALRLAGERLELAGDADVGGLPAQDAKDPTRPFSHGDRAGEDAAVEAHHGQRFDAALAWLGRLG